jgi:hypothetical protein
VYRFVGGNYKNMLCWKALNAYVMVDAQEIPVVEGELLAGNTLST